jgi:small GTP-binding protein
MFRVVLIGSTTVGKTSIHLRIASEGLEPEFRPTTGGKFIVHTEQCDDLPTSSLQIWDTAGQDRFRAIAPIYYRDAQAAIAVFAVDNQESYNDLPGWINEFEATAGTEEIVFVVANKMDLVGTPEVEIVDLTVAETWATEQGYRFFKTSALKNEGISEFLHELALEIARRHVLPKGKVESATGPEKSRCC